MKVCVINFSGNVGKSTVAAHLLKPRMTNAALFSVESLNNDAASDGVDVETYKGKKYKDLQEQIFLLEDAIVDVGASNVEDFYSLMSKYRSSNREFDYYIVPTVKEKKQSMDTVATIKALFALGIPKRKIRVVFNKVELDEDIKEEFEPVFTLTEAHKSFTVYEECVIYNNEAFDECKELGLPLADLVADETDYGTKAKAARDAGDQVEAKRCVNLHFLKMVATTASNNMDNVFGALFK